MKTTTTNKIAAPFQINLSDLLYVGALLITATATVAGFVLAM